MKAACVLGNRHFRRMASCTERSCPLSALAFACVVLACQPVVADPPVDTREASTAQVVSALLEALGSTDDEVAEGAADGLRALGPAASAAASELLQRALAGEGVVRERCLDALVGIGPWAAPALRAELPSLLQHQDVQVRLRACRWMLTAERSARPFLPHVWPLLEDAYPGIRGHAIEILERSPTADSTFAEKMRTLLRDPIPAVRVCAATAILSRNPNDQTAFEELWKWYRSRWTPDPFEAAARHEAGSGFWKLRSIQRRVLPELKRMVERELESDGPTGLCMLVLHLDPTFKPARQGLVTALPRFSRDDGLRIALEAIHLGVCRQEAQRIVQERIGSQEIPTRDGLNRLSTLGDALAPAIPVIVRGLDSPDTWSRIFALRSITPLGPRARAATGALEARCSDFVPCIRHLASIALAGIGERGAALGDLLLSALGDPDGDTREGAIRALGRWPRDARMEARLREIAEDPKECAELAARARELVRDK